MDKYRTLPFCTNTLRVDFYTYYAINDLAGKALEDKEIMLKCRTIGILQSIYGKFHLSDLDAPNNAVVQMSAIYLKYTLPSTVSPYPVQVFGILRWKKKPVIYAMMVQVLTTKNAIRARNAMKNITERHLATPATMSSETETQLDHDSPD